MTVIALPQRVSAATKTSHGRAWPWLWEHRLSIPLLSVLLIVVGIANWTNFDGYPGRINDDEGTYVAQAWAVIYRGELAHYTYWYDHPPLGWLLIAGYAWLTDGFDRAATAVTVGREFMLIVNLVSSSLLYLLARRLQFHRIWASVAVLLFALSPLAVYYHRMVFLDNIAVMWLLGACKYSEVLCVGRAGACR